MFFVKNGIIIKTQDKLVQISSFQSFVCKHHSHGSKVTSHHTTRLKQGLDRLYWTGKAQALLIFNSLRYLSHLRIFLDAGQISVSVGCL